MAFEQVFKNIDNALRTDEGCSSELGYVEQSSWILFLKYLDDLDKENEMAALLGGTFFFPILDEEYRWNTWAMPRTKSGEYDIPSALVGDDLIEFVNGKLFPYLKNLGQGETDNTSIKVKIGLIFAELRNKLVSGYCMRDILEQNGGEYYTPRPLIRSIVKVVNPKIGESVYDGAWVPPGSSAKRTTICTNRSIRPPMRRAGFRSPRWTGCPPRHSAEIGLVSFP